MRIGKLRLEWKPRVVAPRPGVDEAVLQFRCNVCGERTSHSFARMDRESPSCGECGSTVRFRSIVHLLSMHFFGKSLVIDEFPSRHDICGVGMSDWEGYAAGFARRFQYTNTFYHVEPKLDILTPPAELLGKQDFVISSEVLEHVPPPPRRAFDNLAQLLKPGGLLILTVPFSTEAATREHFPELFDYSIEEDQNGRFLRNRTASGVQQIFRDLVFHGGPGATLEMRLYAKVDLLALLAQAGFTEIRVRDEPCFDHGIHHSEPWSLPITAVRAG